MVEFFFLLKLFAIGSKLATTQIDLFIELV